MIRYAFGVAALITFGGPAAAEEFNAKYAAQDWGDARHGCRIPEDFGNLNEQEWDEQCRLYHKLTAALKAHGY